MSRLAYDITVLNPRTNTDVTFTTREDVPAWAEPLITNPNAWADAPVASDPESEVRSLLAGATEDQVAELRKQLTDAGHDDPALAEAQAEVERLKAQVADLQAKAKGPTADDTAAGRNADVETPPRSGQGSGEDDWRAFLAGQNVEVPEGTTGRAAVIAVWDKHLAEQG